MTDPDASPSNEGLTVQDVETLQEEHDGTAITVTSVKVSASEKVSTGDYENYNPHATLDAQVVSAGTWEEQRAQVLQALAGMHKDIQAVLEQATEAKLQMEPAAEQDDWMLQELLAEEAQDE
jgi:hypothetical protein